MAASRPIDTSDLVEVPLFCCKCASNIMMLLPLEPLFSLGDAQWLLPVHSRQYLYEVLSRKKDKIGPPIYRRGVGGRRYRLLRASDLRILRELLHFPIRKRTSDDKQKEQRQEAGAGEGLCPSPVGGCGLSHAM